MQNHKLCLKWNNHTSNLLALLGGFQQKDLLVDVTISCQGQSIKAHKLILSACSPYFQNIFFENPCQHPIIIINGMKFEDVSAILNFMYKGEVNVTQDGLSSFLQAAEALKVKGLAEVYDKNVNAISKEAQKHELNHSIKDTPSRKRPRNRKRSLSDSNKSEDEGSSRKQLREPSPEVHELSGDESFTGDNSSNGPPFNSVPRVPQTAFSRSQQSHPSSNMTTEDDDYEVEPSKMLEQSLTSESNVSLNNSNPDNNLRIERIMGNATEMESSSLQEPESPPDIKPIISYGESSAGPSDGTMMLYNEQSQPGPSNMQDGLLHDNSQAPDFQTWSKELLPWIIEKEKGKKWSLQLLPIRLTVNLPVDTIEDLAELDQYLLNAENFNHMCEYIASRGGRTLANTVNDSLRHFMTNRLAMSFNYKGTRGKNSFEATNLNELIIRSAKKSNGATEVDIVNAIKVWLKHAPQRFNITMKRLYESQANE